MDDIVKAAMAKWPNVPDCYGWLGLDARGHWWMRDAQAQAAGPFAGPGACLDSKGSVLRHDKLIEFIQRNYASDSRGCWYFQNGPQRVYVELEGVPQVWRVQPDGILSTLDGARRTQPQACWMDEQGLLYAQWTEGVMGVVASADMLDAAQLLEQGRWPAVCEVHAQELPVLGGFVRSPFAWVQQHAMR